MDKIETIHERITQLVDTFGKGKNTSFASLIGSNEANVRGYKTSVMPKFDFLEKIARSIDVNLKWLLTGEESMLRNVQEQAAPQSISPAEESFIYKMYEKEKEEKEKLNAKMLQMAEEIGNLKAQISNQPSAKAPEHPPLAFDGGFIDSFTSESSGGSIKDSAHTRNPTTSLKKSSAGKM